MVTALRTAFAAPFWCTVDRFDDGTNVFQTTADPGGSWVALVGLAPVVGAAISLFLPRRLAHIVLTMLASLMTVTALGVHCCGVVPSLHRAAVDRRLHPDRRVARVRPLPQTEVAPGCIDRCARGDRCRARRSLTAPDGVGILSAVVLSTGQIAATLIGVGVRAGVLLLAVGGLALLVVSTLPVPFMMPVWWLGGALCVSGLAGVAAQEVVRAVRGET